MSLTILLGSVLLALLAGRCSSGNLPLANDEDFVSFKSQLEKVHINHQSLSSLLSPMLRYKFSLPEVQLRKGTVYLGSNFRLRRVLMVRADYTDFRIDWLVIVEIYRSVGCREEPETDETLHLSETRLVHDLGFSAHAC